MTTKHFSFVAHGGLDRRLRRERLRPASTRDSMRRSLPGSGTCERKCSLRRDRNGRQSFDDDPTVHRGRSLLSVGSLLPFPSTADRFFSVSLPPSPIPPHFAERPSGYSFPSPAHSGRSSSHLFVSRRSVSSIASPCNVARRALWLLQLGGFVVTYRRTGAS